MTTPISSIVKKIVLISLVLGLSLAGMLFAAELHIILDGTILDTAEAPPQIVEDRTFVPLRLISQELGYAVGYQPETSLVTVGDGVFTHIVGSTSITMADGSVQDIGVASFIANDRTMVSLRLFASALGCEVGWSSETGTVSITSPQTETPEQPTLPAKTVENAYYGFALDIPGNWEESLIDDEHTGFIIDTGSENALLMVTGEFTPAYYSEEFLDMLLEEYGYLPITFADGEEGWLLDDVNFGEIDFIRIRGDVLVSFYIQFDASTSWLEDNFDIIVDSGASLTLTDPEGIPPEIDLEDEDVPELVITSKAIVEGVIDDAYGMRGKDLDKDGIPTLSLPFEIADAPEETVSYVLILADIDAETEEGNPWIHWIVANIPAELTELPAGASIDMAESMVQGENSFGTVGYGGPTPPDQPHEYILNVYALDAMLPLEEGFNFMDLSLLVSGHILAMGQVSGIYSNE